MREHGWPGAVGEQSEGAEHTEVTMPQARDVTASPLVLRPDVAWPAEQ